MENKDKIIRLALIGVIAVLVIAVYMLGTERYKKIKQDNIIAAEKYLLLQTYIINYLDNAETFILLYPLEGSDSLTQKKKAELGKIYEIEIWNRYEMLNFLKSGIVHEEMWNIRNIISEMNIYMNEFNTEEYPADETNLKYMENLFELIVKYRSVLEEELNTYTAEDKKDIFNSENYLKYNSIKKSIAEENNWVISPTASATELETRLSVADKYPIVIKSKEEGIKTALDYFKKTYGDVEEAEIESNLVGESNIIGIMFTNYGYIYKNETMTLLDTGNIFSVQFENPYKDPFDDSDFERVTDEDMKVAKNIAKDYLKKHGMEKYRLEYQERADGMIELSYSYSLVEDYYDYLNVIKFRFINSDEVLLENIFYPNYIESQELDKKQFQEGYNKKEHLKKIVEAEYKVLKALYYNSGNEDNVEKYEWHYEVEKGGKRYVIIIDPASEKIIRAHPIKQEEIEE